MIETTRRCDRCNNPKAQPIYLNLVGKEVETHLETYDCDICLTCASLLLAEVCENSDEGRKIIIDGMKKKAT